MSCLEALQQCVIPKTARSCCLEYICLYIMSCIAQFKPIHYSCPSFTILLPLVMQRFTPGTKLLCGKLMSMNSTSCHSLCSWQLYALKPPLWAGVSLCCFFCYFSCQINGVPFLSRSKFWEFHSEPWAIVVYCGGRLITCVTSFLSQTYCAALSATIYLNSTLGLVQCLFCAYFFTFTLIRAGTRCHLAAYSPATVTMIY